jgi:acyl carrier protein
MLSDGAGASVEAMVARVLVAVLDEGGRSVVDVRADARLVDDLSLKSLELASIVARLEMALDLDAFDSDVAITDVRTVGDITRLFESARHNT